MIQLVALMGYMWEVANDNIAVLYKIVKSHYSIKLTWSNLFRLYFIKKNSWGGGVANGNILERSDW